MKFYRIFATAFTVNAFVSSLEQDSSSRLLSPKGSKENQALRNDFAFQDTAVHDVKYDIFDARELNTLTRTEPVGLSNGEDWGNPFDDFAIVESNTRIEKIVIRSYDYWIRYIGVTYSNGQTFDHGTYSSGTATDTAELVVELDEDEYIVRAFGGYGWWVNRIGFETSKGNIYGDFGPAGGGVYEFDFGAENALVHIFGRVSDRLYLLGFAYGPVPSSQPSSMPSLMYSDTPSLTPSDMDSSTPSLRATPSPTPSPSIRTQTQISSMPTETIDMFPPGDVETFSLVGGVQCLAERLRLAIASFQLLQNIICFFYPSF